MKGEVDDVKKFYEETIINLIKMCDDIDLLNLITKLLLKSNGIG